MCSLWLVCVAGDTKTERIRLRICDRFAEIHIVETSNPQEFDQHRLSNSAGQFLRWIHRHSLDAWSILKNRTVDDVLGDCWKRLNNEQIIISIRVGRCMWSFISYSYFSGLENPGASFEGAGGRRTPPPPPRKKKKKKKDRKKREKRKKKKKKKKERRELWITVKLLHKKCCFSWFFNSPVALENKKKILPPQEKDEMTPLGISNKVG